MDGQTSNQYQIIEEKVFTKQLLKLRNLEYVDESLGILSEALRKNPGQFKTIAGTQHLRQAKTKQYERDGVIVPSLKVLFVIEITDDVKYVKLKYNETIENDLDY